MKTIIAVCFIIMMAGCSTTASLRAFNYISLGMDRHLVLEQLGQPDTSKGFDKKKVLVYYIEEGGYSYASQTFWVIFEQDQVVFYGRQREYRNWVIKSQMIRKR